MNLQMATDKNFKGGSERGDTGSADPQNVSAKFADQDFSKVKSEYANVSAEVEQKELFNKIIHINVLY